MKFTEPNFQTDDYLAHFKAFQLSCVAVSAGGYAAGFSDRFLGLLDGGAKNTCIIAPVHFHIRPANGFDSF